MSLRKAAEVFLVQDTWR